MKIDFREVYETQETFEEIVANQVEILEQLKTAVTSLIVLETWQGAGAASAKAYWNETHKEIIETLLVMLSELGTRFYSLTTNFSDTVDNGYTPVLSTEYIAGVSSTLGDLKQAFLESDKLFEDSIATVSDLFTPESSSFSSYVSTGYDACITKANAVKDSLDLFESNHASDLLSVNDTIEAVRTAFSRMQELSTLPLDIYEPGAANTSGDFTKLGELRFAASAYLAENIEIVSDSTITMITLLGIPLALLSDLEDGYEDLTEGLRYEDLLKMYSVGMRYELQEVDGKLIYRLITDIEDPAALQKYLSDLGCPQLKFDKLTELTTDGIPVQDLDTGELMNKKIMSALENMDEFVEVSDTIDGTGPAKKIRVLKNLNTIGKVADGVGYLLTTAVSAYQNIYNERTGKWEIVDGDNWKDTITDAGTGIALDLGASAAGAALGAKAGAAIGTAICPGPGTVIGGIVGGIAGAVGASLAISLPEFGEPPKSVTDYVADGVEFVTDEAGKFFSKLFW